MINLFQVAVVVVVYCSTCCLSIKYGTLLLLQLLLLLLFHSVGQWKIFTLKLKCNFHVLRILKLFLESHLMNARSIFSPQLLPLSPSILCHGVSLISDGFLKLIYISPAVISLGFWPLPATILTSTLPADAIFQIDFLFSC